MEKLDEKIFVPDEKTNWYIISSHYNLSENFIRKHKNGVHWFCISVCQKLSEDFIKEFEDKMCFQIILMYQNVSDGFLIEMGFLRQNYDISLEPNFSLLDI